MGFPAQNSDSRLTVADRGGHDERDILPKILFDDNSTHSGGLDTKRGKQTSL